MELREEIVAVQTMIKIEDEIWVLMYFPSKKKSRPTITSDWTLPPIWIITKGQACIDLPRKG